jgi:hypothetical protein
MVFLFLEDATDSLHQGYRLVGWSYVCPPTEVGIKGVGYEAKDASRCKKDDGCSKDNRAIQWYSSG